MALQRRNPDSLPPATGYSQVVEASGSRMIFVAGQVARDADGNLVAPGDVVGQARQAFANVRTALEAVGASLADVVKITWFVVGFRPEQLPELGAARSEVFEGIEPASTLIGVQSLAAPEFLVEVEAIAVL